MLPRTIVVIGGALSGPAAAARARETDENARIILLERSQDVSYAVCGLAYHLSGEVPSLAALNRERAEFFQSTYKIEVRTGAQVSRIDVVGKRVHLDGESMPFDSLIYAAGADSVIPDISGLQEAKNLFRFRTLKDLSGIMALLKKGAKNVAVLGGGFLGVEAADGFLRRKCKVTIVEQAPHLLPRFSSVISSVAESALKEAGATILSGAAVKGVKMRGSAIQALELSSGKSLKVDLVIVATGLRPRTRLLQGAGVRLHPDGTVQVDERCMTSIPDLYACGVCVSLPHAVTGRAVWFAQAAQADKSAQVAGSCAAGGDSRITPVTGAAMVRCSKVAVGRAGLTETEARAFTGSDFGLVCIHAPSHDRFYPEAETVTLALFYNKSNGLILGGEVASRRGCDKRVDLLATAILGKLTVEQFGTLDLGYAPPFSSARDPVNVAGAVAASERRGLAVGLSPQEVEKHLDEMSLIDVRPDAERKKGMIRGAIGVPLHLLRQKLGDLASARRAVFVDETGREGYLAARIAAQQGMQAREYLSGGVRSWRSLGYPLTKKGGKKARTPVLAGGVR